MSVKFLRKNPHLKEKLAKTLKTLEADIFHASLKTHHLHGSLAKYMACSINYEYRVLFTFSEMSVFLHVVGTHDEIY